MQLLQRVISRFTSPQAASDAAGEPDVTFDERATVPMPSAQTDLPGEPDIGYVEAEEESDAPGEPDVGPDDDEEEAEV
jgi:hypothetical protein